MKIVVIDPRRTATCEFADLHLPVRAGTDVWLFNGLLAYLHQHGAVRRDFVDAHTIGVDRALLVAENTAGDVARRRENLRHRCSGSSREFYQPVRAHREDVITVFSQGVNQSSAGTDKVNSIINCHLLTGRIGRPGMGPFSITGQPNAMGGREVGGLANMLAAHMDLDERGRIAHRADSSGTARASRAQPGLKAVDLFDAIHDGRIKAVWIMATNPVVSLPDADKVREALRRCELVVVSDCVAAHRHERARACAAARRRLGRERRHRHQFRSAHLAPARLPAAARRSEARLVDHLRGRAAHGLRAGLRLRTRRTTIFVEHARLSGAENDGDARVRYRRPRAS